MLAASLGASSLARAEEPSQPAHSDAEPVPSFAFWTGTRIGVFIPYGALYTDATFVTTLFQDVATAGPTMELDAGARFARHFIGYGFLDQASLGRGNNAAWTAPHGGQSPPSTKAVGIGLRWESNPEGLGLVVDAAVAYRWFTARWEDATTLRMGGPGEVHFGIGASGRIARHVTLAPMMTVFSGAFANRSLENQELGDSASSYSAVTFHLTGHIDVYSR